MSIQKDIITDSLEQKKVASPKTPNSKGKSLMLPLVETSGVSGTDIDLAVIQNMTPAALAAAINEGHLEAENQLHTARQHFAAGLKGALRTGAYLLEVNRRFKKKWGFWLKEFCPDLPTSTAYRYLDLAKKFPHVRNAEEVTSLRQAYIACEILPEAAPKGKKQQDLNKLPSAVTGGDFAARITSMRVFFAAEIQRFDCDELEQPVRQNLLAEVSALRTTLSNLIERLEVREDRPALLKFTADSAKEAA